MNSTSLRIVLLTLSAIASAAAQPNARAELKPAPERKPASHFALTDSDGETATLEQYRGKVVLLDFWATWCTGCKQEIPWFAEFQQKFGAKDFAVVGVSLDEGGWAAVKPFLAKNFVPCRMLLGNEATARSYGIEGLPDTFILDRQGRVAAAYLASLADKDNLEVNIRALLSQR